MRIYLTVILYWIVCLCHLVSFDDIIHIHMMQENYIYICCFYKICPKNEMNWFIYAYLFIVDHMLCFQTMLTWVQHAASISECLALALSIQVLLNVPLSFFVHLNDIVSGLFHSENWFVWLGHWFWECSGDSDIIKTLPGDQWWTVGHCLRYGITMFLGLFALFTNDVMSRFCLKILFAVMVVVAWWLLTVVETIIEVIFVIIGYSN